MSDDREQDVEEPGAPRQRRPDPEDGPAWIRRRPGLPFAAVALFSCFLPLVAPGTPLGFGFSLFEIVSYAGLMRGFASLTPGASDGIVAAFWCFYLFYAVPAAAAWLLFRELRGEAGDRLRLRVGLTGLLGPFLVFALIALILALSLPEREGRQIAESALTLFTNFGFGWILLIASSAALIAVGRGWRPFGPASGD